MSNEKPVHTLESSSRKAESVSIGRGKIDRESLNTTATRFSVALGTKLEGKFKDTEVAFDIVSFKSKFLTSIEKVFLNSSIPEIAKEKFKLDLLSKIDLLAKIDLSDIEKLRASRIAQSLGIEAWEISRTFGNDEAKIRGYYLGKILDETLSKYVEPTTHGLLTAFADEKKKVGSTEYHRNTLNTFHTSIASLDAKYAVNMSEVIKAIAKDMKRNANGDISREDLYREVGIRLVDILDKKQRIPQANFIKEQIKNGNLTERSKF
jgi:hypothetical protein